MSNVYAWLRSMLITESPFYLFTTPPPTCVAEDAKTLFEARLAPAVLLLFGWGTGPCARLPMPSGTPQPPLTAMELLAPHAIAAVVSDLDAPCALAGSGEACAPSVPLVTPTPQPGDAHLNAMAANLMGGPPLPNASHKGGAVGSAAGTKRLGAGAPSWLKTNK